jgi:hypothetical protein
MYLTPGLLGFVLLLCAVGAISDRPAPGMRLSAGQISFGLILGFVGLSLIICEAHDWLTKFHVI